MARQQIENTISKIRFGIIDAMEDGSGAPTTVEIMGNVYALDYLGSVKVSGIKVSNAFGNRLRAIRAYYLEKAVEIYENKIAELGADWLEANRRMYA